MHTYCIYPYSAKRAHEESIAIKQKKLPHLPLVFNNANVTQSISQKHLGIIKFTFEKHLKIGDY